MKKILLASLLCLTLPALAQPGPGPVPSPWVVSGSTIYYIKGAVGIGTSTPNATNAVTIASIGTGAGLNLRPGSAPATPVNGDLWMTTTGLYGRVNGSTVSFSTGSGCIPSGSANQILTDAGGGVCTSNANAKVDSDGIKVGSGTLPSGILAVFGTQNVNNSINPGVLLTRNVVSSLSSVNFHGFSDSSSYSLGPTSAANSYDCRTTVNGIYTLDHYVCFQAAAVYNGTGAAGIFEGGYFSSTVNFGGTADYQYSIELQPPANGGTLNNYQAAIKINADPAAGATSHYTVRSLDINPAEFAGCIAAGILNQADTCGGTYAIAKYYGVVTPNVLVDGPLLNNIAQGQGAIFSGGSVGDKTIGLTIAGYGTTYDLLALNANLQTIFSVGDGLQDIVFAGKVRANGAYYSGATIGVTCSGSPTGSFASTLGIVTHC